MPYSAQEMIAYSVSTKVISPKNNRPFAEMSFMKMDKLQSLV